MSLPSKNGGQSSAPHDNGESDAAPPSYNAFSNDQSVADGHIPPADDEVEKVNLTEAFDRLTLGAKPKFPDEDTCLAHLKLLFAMQVMKEEVGYTDGLWDTWDARADDNAAASELTDMEEASVSTPAPPIDEGAKKRLAVLSKLREKRWAIFVARAVDRYEAWWTSMQRPGAGLTEADMCDMYVQGLEKYERFVSADNDLLAWDASSLPPLGQYSFVPRARLLKY